MAARIFSESSTMMSRWRSSPALRRTAATRRIAGCRLLIRVSAPTRSSPTVLTGGRSSWCGCPDIAELYSTCILRSSGSSRLCSLHTAAADRAVPSSPRVIAVGGCHAGADEGSVVEFCHGMSFQPCQCPQLSGAIGVPCFGRGDEQSECGWNRMWCWRTEGPASAESHVASLFMRHPCGSRGVRVDGNIADLDAVTLNKLQVADAPDCAEVGGGGLEQGECLGRCGDDGAGDRDSLRELRVGLGATDSGECLAGEGEQVACCTGSVGAQIDRVRPRCCVHGCFVVPTPCLLGCERDHWGEESEQHAECGLESDNR